MDSELFDRFLGLTKFSGDTKAQYFSSKDNLIQQKWLCEEDVEDSMLLMDLGNLSTLDAPSNFHPTIQVIAVPGTGRLSPIQTSKTLFTKLHRTCQFPNHLLQALFANNGQFAHFVEYAGEMAEYLSIVICFPHSPLKSQACALRTRLTDRATVCLILDDDEERIPTTLHRLHLRREHLQNSPLHIVSILAEEFGRQNERLRENLDLSTVKMERYIVTMGKYIGTTGFEIDPLVNPDDGFQELVQDVQMANMSLIWLDAMTNFELQLYHFGSKMVAFVEDLRRDRRETELSAPARAGMEQETGFNVNGCQLRRYQASGLQQRVQTQINLLYSQLSQRDNRINISVAQDSRRIASATLSDSRAMKTIAVVTLLFLPANLIASIYSTGIIDVGLDQIQVSKFWWTYATSAVVLTSLAFLIWIFAMRQWERQGTVSSSATHSKKRAQ